MNSVLHRRRPAGAAGLDVPATPARSGLRSLLGDSAIYGIGVAAPPVALLAVTPLIARALGPFGYGAIDVLMTAITIVGLVALLGMDGASARSFFDYGDHEVAERHLVTRTAVAIVAGASLALSAVLLAGALVFELGVLPNASTRTLATTVAAFAVLPLLNTQLIAREVFRFTRRRSLYLASSLIQAAGVVVATVALVELAGAPGYFIGIGIGALTGLVFTAIKGNFLTTKRELDLVEARKMLSYGLPLVPAALATWVVFAVDRALLVSIKGLWQAGIYGLASRACALVLMAISAFMLAWGPFILAQPPERRAEFRARALTAATAASAVIAVGLILFARPVVEVLGGGEFFYAADAVPGIAIGWVGWAAASVLTTEFAVERRTLVIGVMTAVAAAANVVLNLLLIPSYGYLGAAWASAGTFFMLAVLYWWWERREAAVPYRWGRLALIAFVLAAATSVALRHLAEETPARVSVFALCAVALVGIAASDRGARNHA